LGILGVHHIGASAKKRLECPTSRRRVGMQGKVDILRCDPIRLCELFNTHGTEVAPRSNVIAEDFENCVVAHGVLRAVNSLKRLTFCSLEQAN
jgi:hypothetical protein